MFAQKLERGEKLSAKRESVHDGCDYTLYDDCVVDAPASRRCYEKTELLPLKFYEKYKICGNVSYQLLSCYCFERKSVKWCDCCSFTSVTLP